MFFPGFTQPQQFFTAWQTAVREQLRQFEQLDEQISEAHKRGLERTSEAIDHGAELMKASLTYTQTLGEQWRKQAVATARQTADLFTTFG